MSFHISLKQVHQNADGAVSLHAAIDYLESFGMDAIEAYEEELVAYILPKIVALPHVHVIGSQNPKEKHGVIAFTVDDVHPHDVATIWTLKAFVFVLDTIVHNH